MCLSPKQTQRKTMINSTVPKMSLKKAPSTDKTKTKLPDDFVPSNHSVICGNKRRFFNSPGNQRFRQICAKYVSQFQEADSKHEKSFVVTQVMREIRSDFTQGIFVAFEKGCWWEVSERTSREKVGTFFRDALADTYKSSAKNKIAQRKMKRSSTTSASSNSSLADGSSSNGSITSQTVLENLKNMELTLEMNNKKQANKASSFNQVPTMLDSTISGFSSTVASAALATQEPSWMDMSLLSKQEQQQQQQQQEMMPLPLQLPFSNSSNIAIPQPDPLPVLLSSSNIALPTNNIMLDRQMQQQPQQQRPSFVFSNMPTFTPSPNNNNTNNDNDDLLPLEFLQQLQQQPDQPQLHDPQIEEDCGSLCSSIGSSSFYDVDDLTPVIL